MTAVMIHNAVEAVRTNVEQATQHANQQQDHLPDSQTRSLQTPGSQADNDSNYNPLGKHTLRIVSGPVAVVTAKTVDADRVAGLLSRAGLDRSKIVACDEIPVSTTGIYALVLVHRRSESVSLNADIDSDVHSNPSLRKIVITDCQLEETIVQFLDEGARHCLNLNESDSILQARLEAALRIHPGTAQQSFSVGDIHFDIQKRKASRGGIVIELSPKEFEFARYLFSNPDKVVGNAELMTSVWSLPTTMDSRRIDTAACRVRKKLRLSGDHGWKLKRIRRVGYHLQAV